MRHINKNMCGYSTNPAEPYKCVGLPEINSAITNAVMTCTGMFDFLRIPEKIKGFVAKLEYIYDMENAYSAAPEKVCSDDSSTTGPGFVDAFNKFGPIYAGMNVTGIPGDMSDIPMGTIELDQEDLPCYGDNVMLPGLLEPPLAVSYQPEEPVQPPPFDPYVIYLHMILTRITGIESLISLLGNDYTDYDTIKEYRALPVKSNINGLERLLAADRGSSCDEFGINYNSGNVLGIDSEAPDARYSVSGGSIKINGKKFNVGGISSEGAPFKLYLNIDVDDNGEQNEMSISNVSLGTSKSGTLSFELGGVRQLDSNNVQGSSADRRYRMLKIDQFSCAEDMDIVRTARNGFLYRTNSGNGMPYIAYPGSTCD